MAIQFGKIPLILLSFGRVACFSATTACCCTTAAFGLALTGWTIKLTPRANNVIPKILRIKRSAYVS